MLRNLFYLLILCFPIISIAQNDEQNDEKYVPMENVDSFRKGIEEMAKKTKSIQANFIQEKHLNILSKKINSSGSMVFKKPNYLKWSYTTPYNYFIILDNNEVMVSDEGKEMNFDISSSQLFKEINDMIINSIQGDILDKEKFLIEYFESGNRYKVNLIPKEDKLKEYLTSISLFFNKEAYLVSQIIMHEAGEDYTLIKFKDQQLNAPTPDEKTNP